MQNKFKTAITQVIAASKKQMTTHSSNSLTSVKQEAKAYLTKWKSPSDIERQFSPNNWGYTLSHPDKAYMADCPTLVAYEQIYGEGVSADWIRIQVLTLFGASNCKDIGVADGIKLFAQSFAQEVKTYKLSELMLFFARYKAGRYDNSYASFDAKRIGNAFFHEFVKERNNELDRITRQQNQQEIEERSFTPPKGYSSYSWYQELKRRASKGDSEAIKLLTKL